jgi:hypothetical protein
MRSSGLKIKIELDEEEDEDLDEDEESLPGTKRKNGGVSYNGKKQNFTRW